MTPFPTPKVPAREVPKPKPIRTDFQGRPARFLMRNSKGHPDFVMTMLVTVIVATLLVLLFWTALNLLAFRAPFLTKPAASSEAAVATVDSTDTATPPVATQDPLLDDDQLDYLRDLLDTFNEHAQLIVLGLASSIFSLAGAYYLRRASYDKHYERMRRDELDRILPRFEPTAAPPEVAPGIPYYPETHLHPPLDRTGEDI